MDAGPNVKVLCLEEDLDRLADHFRKDYQVIVSRALRSCQMPKQSVQSGPVKLVGNPTLLENTLS